jgi:putative endonuclease
MAYVKFTGGVSAAVNIGIMDYSKKKNCIYKNRLGSNGEIIAKKFLSDKKYKFVKSNYRFERAEIDLIFEIESDRTLLFVEVKTRKNLNFGEPIESVTLTKQNRIRKAIDGFIMENESYADHDVRIDVISILIQNGKANIEHIENAF